MKDTIESILAEIAALLARAGYQEPRRWARRLIGAVLGLSLSELLLLPERTLCSLRADRLRALADRMAGGEPLSRVLGRREFWGLDFILSPETLDPRPESETIVEAVLAEVPNRACRLKLLDLGTGTGCLLLALLSELPGAIGVGVDIAEDAVATALRNARALRLADRARFFVGDWGSALAGPFDVIVANPPYIATAALGDLPREVAGYDSPRALDGGEDGLVAYREIASHLAGLLAPEGIFVGEVGAGQIPPLAVVLKDNGLRIDATIRDLSGIERCLAVRMATPGLSGGDQKNLGMSECRV